MMTLLSIIVPIYNSEKTLERCLDSIVTQLEDTIEVWLINDGSTDGSEKICKHYASCYSQINYIKQNNKGVSSARNVGLASATGKYIFFVDSDDCLSDHFFSPILRLAEKHDPDIIQFNISSLKKFDENYLRLKFNTIYRMNDVVPSIQLLFSSSIANSLCSKVFRSDIVRNNDIRFCESISIAEDISWIYSFFAKAKTIVLTDKATYIVDKSNNNSLSRKIRTDLDDSLYIASMNILDSINLQQVTTPYQKMLYNIACRLYYRSVYSALLSVLRQNLPKQECKKRVRSICDKFAKNNIKTNNFSNFCIAFPIKHRMYTILTVLVKFRKKIRNSI